MWGRRESVTVVFVLWECPVYDTIRNTVRRELENLLWGSFEDFRTLNKFRRIGFNFGLLLEE